jgi:predicted dehydrogenase
MSGMENRKLKIALVGCGQIADAHLQEIRKIDIAQVLAVCDRQVDLARQAGERFEVPGVYEDLDRMLAEVRPDVLHITTPPQSHLMLATKAMRAGCHVYVEKPFTIDVDEADKLLDSARENGKRVCVGHDHLFDPVWEECRQLVSSGKLGDVLHVDSIQGYDLGGPFGKMFAAESDHWVHRLPGGLFQNVMSHAMYRITDLIPDESPKFFATWFGAVSEARTPTELRVLIKGEHATANLLFSSTIRPVQRVATIRGSKGTIEVDLDGRTIRWTNKITAPGPFAKIQAPMQHWREGARALRKSIGKFIKSDIHYFAGMNRLMTLFYQSILSGGEVPIPPGEIRRMTAWMDEIFHQCRLEQAGEEESLLAREGSVA